MKSAILAILGLLVACGGVEPPPAPMVPEPYTGVLVGGTWFEEFQCEQVCDGKVTPLDGTTRFEIAQDGPRLTRTDESGAVWEGRISGTEATLRTFAVGFEEELEMTFAEDLERFVSEAFYHSAEPVCSGTCTGSGRRD